MPVRELTIVIPAFDEVRRIEPTLEKILAYLPGPFDAAEVLVVDDGSTDGTGDLVRSRFGGKVGLVRREQRGGKGAAIRAGVAAAKKPWVLFVDADLSIPIEEAASLAAQANGAPIVIGSKRAPGSRVEYPGVRRVLGGIGQLLISTFVVSGFGDTQCGFKLYRTDVARELFGHARIDGFGFDFELLFLARRLGYPVIEVPVSGAHRLGSTVRPGTYLRVLAEVARLCTYRARGLYPRPRVSG